MAPTRSTLIIKFDPEFSCLLSAESPTPIHIFALLTQPLSGTCHTLNTLAAKARHAGSTKGSSTSANNNIQSRVFAADVTVIGAEPTDNADGGAASIAAAAAMPQQACLKYAMGVEEVAALRCEGLLYSRELAALADVAVPKTYGFFTGGTELAPVACLVMDLCVSTEVLRSANEFWCVLLPTTSALACNSDCVCFVDVWGALHSRLAMLALCKVHAAGVLHNTSLNLRHFVMKGKKVFLVDFALAMVHQCENAHPALWNEALRPAAVTEDCWAECGELIVAERNIFSQIGEQLPLKINPLPGLTTVVL